MQFHHKSSHCNSVAPVNYRLNIFAFLLHAGGANFQLSSEAGIPALYTDFPAPNCRVAATFYQIRSSKDGAFSENRPQTVGDGGGVILLSRCGGERNSSHQNCRETENYVAAAVICRKGSRKRVVVYLWGLFSVFEGVERRVARKSAGV